METKGRWRTRVIHYQECDLLAAHLKLPPHLEGYGCTKASSTEQIRSFGLERAKFPEVVRSDFLDARWRCLVIVETHCLESVKGLVGPEMTRELGKCESSYTTWRHPEERSLPATRLNRDQGGPGRRP